MRAYLLDRFKAIRDGDGTLLDNSMIVYGKWGDSTGRLEGLSDL